MWIVLSATLGLLPEFQIRIVLFYGFPEILSVKNLDTLHTVCQQEVLKLCLLLQNEQKLTLDLLHTPTAVEAKS